MIKTLSLLTAALMTIAAAPAPIWTLVIHGGAGVIERAKLKPEADAAIRAALALSLETGSAVLKKGGTSLDAVEAAIRILEDDPHFNAGRGAVFTYEGTNSLDAAIMDGRDRRAGAVAGTMHTKNPVGLARAVMEHSPHVMLSGAGADEFSVDLKYGTVGAVAVDTAGHVAAATSTGGLTGKRWGRIGDAPVIGAGTYADDRACAVSATGAGEFFIREGVAHEICARVRFKREKIVKAAGTVMAEVKALGGDGGVIVVGPDGDGGWSFNTPGMYRGRVSSTKPAEVAIYGDE
jgi:L-asparaginase / beta-aspartyl-peptidase